MSVDFDNWQGEMPATLLFIVKGGRVLLMEKQRGIGMGKINAPGGKIDRGETALVAAIRETEEEVCVTPLNPVKMGELLFAMSDIPDIHCHVYVATDYVGTPAATPEAIPLWFEIADIPYLKMWEDDAHWLPEMLDGEKFIGRFAFEGERMTTHEVLTGDDVCAQWLPEGTEAHSLG